MNTNVSSLGAAKATISTASPTVCSGSGGNSYWVMVLGPTVLYEGYAQDGWLTTSTGTATEFGEASSTGTGDPGPLLYNSVSGTHSYTTQMYNVYAHYQALYYMDGTSLGSSAVDWGVGNNFQAATEVHDSGNKIGTVDYTNLQRCTFTGGNVGKDECSPDTSQPSLSSQNGNPVNPNGCYWQTGSYSFETYGVNSSGGC
jgi:hypothetical protein